MSEGYSEEAEDWQHIGVLMLFQIVDEISNVERRTSRHGVTRIISISCSICRVAVQLP